MTAISPLVTETAQRLGELLRAGRGSLPVAAAVTEVHTETSSEQPVPAGGGPLLAVVCTLIAVGTFAACLLLLAWQQRRRARRLRDDQLRKEENCNNVQNEKNLRRYRNRLDAADGDACRAGCTSDACRDGYKLKELDAPPGGATAAPAAKRRDSMEACESPFDSPRLEKPALYKPVNVNNLAPPRGAGPSKEINKEILRGAALRQSALSRTLREDSPEFHEVLV